MHTSVRAAALAVVVALSACGGNDDGAGGQPLDASLVPEPPVPGAMLYAQASELRPLRDGAVWTYRGHDFVAGTVFENVVRQQGSASAVTETHSRDPALRVTISMASNGDVMQSGEVTLPWGGQALQIDAVELRSPVRANEQVTLFDGVIDDIGIDLDADGTRDGARVGAYSRVVGNEDVALPGVLLLPLRALRVDTHVAVAPRLSGGKTSVTTERVLSTWYAQGIGPVRTALRSTVASREFDEEELLVVWDGITEGLGYLAQTLVFPSGTGALAGTPVPPSTLELALADGALVLTGAGDGYAMHRLDLRGALVATQLLPAAALTGYPYALFRLRSGPCLVTQSEGTFHLYRFTDGGEPIGSEPVASLAGFSVIGAAAGGDGVWTGWQTSEVIDVGGGDDVFDAQAHTLWLQRFAEDGLALTAPVAVATAVSRPLIGGTPYLQAPVVSATTAVLPWYSFGYDHGNIAMASNEGASLPAAISAIGVFPKPVSDGSSHWILWENVNPADTPDGSYRPHGARLSASGSYVFDSTGEPTKQAIAALNAETGAGWPNQYAASEGHLVGVSRSAGEKFWPEDAAPSDWFTLRDLDATATVLSTGARLVAQVRVPLPAGGPPLLFADRALVIGERGGQLQTIVVWRR